MVTKALKTTLKLTMCDDCGALVGDRLTHMRAAHPHPPPFSTRSYDINIPTPKVRKNVVKKEKT